MGRRWGEGQTLGGAKQLGRKGLEEWKAEGLGRFWGRIYVPGPQGGIPSSALAHALPTTDHAPSQSKGSLDRLDEKPLDLGPPLPPKAEAGTFGSDRQTPRPGSAGEVGLAKQGEGHGWSLASL